MLTLTRDELFALTGYVRRTDQARMLDQQGIPYKLVGRQVVVLSDHVRAWAENRPIRQEVGIDFSAVR